jgi:hypothetical protein
MSRNQRIMLVVAALAVAVVAFVILNPGSDDDSGEQAAETTTTETQTETQDETVTETETQPEPAPEPSVTRIQIQGGQVVGGAKRIETTKGEPVQIVVSSDAPDEIHLHGYDIEKTAEPGAPARFSFKANLEGVFEMESHTAEDAGQEPLIANLVVNPS